ncbi:MAG: hypothetical protein LBT40_08670 [Deltaproteobacteria bacterium]|nr:hypothetical protein [Deltaproteobacteria bacterium]
MGDLYPGPGQEEITIPFLRESFSLPKELCTHFIHTVKEGKSCSRLFPTMDASKAAMIDAIAMDVRMQIGTDRVHGFAPSEPGRPLNMFPMIMMSGTALKMLTRILRRTAPEMLGRILLRMKPEIQLMSVPRVKPRMAAKRTPQVAAITVLKMPPSPADTPLRAGDIHILAGKSFGPEKLILDASREIGLEVMMVKAGANPWYAKMNIGAIVVRIAG